MLIATNPRTNDKGWWLIKQFMRIDQVNAARRRHFSLRFGKYFVMDILKKKKKTWTKSEWKEAMLELTGEFDIVRRKASDRADKETYNRLYRRILKIPGIGELATNHVIGVATIVGLVPLSYFPLVNGGADKFYEGLEDFYKAQNEQEDDPSNHYHLPPKTDVVENVGYLAL